MSTPRPPGSTVNPTRVMLDELDALMARMLSLPVSDADLLPQNDSAPLADEEASSQPGTSAGNTDLALVPLADSQLTPVEAPVPVPPLGIQGPHRGNFSPGKVIVGRLTAPPVFGAEGQEPGNTSKESALLGEQPSGDWAPSAPQDDLLPNLTALWPVSPGNLVVPLRRPLSSWCWKGLLWLNQAYDRSTAGLGLTGKWLRSTAGRCVLGIAGILLLALAVTWCLHDWLGWTWMKDSVE